MRNATQLRLRPKAPAAPGTTPEPALTLFFGLALYTPPDILFFFFLLSSSGLAPQQWHPGKIPRGYLATAGRAGSRVPACARAVFLYFVLVRSVEFFFFSCLTSFAEVNRFRWLSALRHRRMRCRSGPLRRLSMTTRFCLPFWRCQRIRRRSISLGKRWTALAGLEGREKNELQISLFSSLSRQSAVRVAATVFLPLIAYAAWPGAALPVVVALRDNPPLRFNSSGFLSRGIMNTSWFDKCVVNFEGQDSYVHVAIDAKLPVPQDLSGVPLLQVTLTSEGV